MSSLERTGPDQAKIVIELRWPRCRTLSETNSISRPRTQLSQTPVKIEGPKKSDASPTASETSAITDSGSCSQPQEVGPIGTARTILDSEEPPWVSSVVRVRRPRPAWHR